MKQGTRLLGLAVAIAVLSVPASSTAQPEVEAFISGTEFPTNLAFAPDGRLFFTEKDTGRVRIIQDGRLLPEPFITVPVTNTAEAGLLGIALHPEFETEPWVYLYYSADDRNRIDRVRADGNRGTTMERVLDGTPTQSYHNGGDITFGPDGKLYAVLGEAHDPNRAQDHGDLGGKILRLEPDGSIPSDNPFGEDSAVYSMGHRNSFGICFDPLTGNLWETENGPESHDELNRIEAGENYGWPVASGPAGKSGFVDPELDFPEVIIPTGCAVYTGPLLDRLSEGALFFGDFHGRLHLVQLSSDRSDVADHTVAVSGLPGITDVQMGPDGRLYIATMESILRLPGEVLASPSPTGDGTVSPQALPAVPDGESSSLPWILGGAAAGFLALALLAARLRQTRR